EKPDELEEKKQKTTLLLTRIYRDYRISSGGDRFYFNDHPDKLAFKDNGNKLVTSLNDERVAFSMVLMAEARGWTAIKLSGLPDFRRIAWMEASLRSMKVHGFIPHERDIQELDHRMERTMRNTVEPQINKNNQAGEHIFKPSDVPPNQPD